MDNVETQSPSFLTKKRKFTPWTKDHDRALLKQLLIYGNTWEKISSKMQPRRSSQACKVRHAKLKEGGAVGEDIEETLRRQQELPSKLVWTEEEVSTLVEKTNFHRDQYDRIIWSEVSPFFENRKIRALQAKHGKPEVQNLVKASDRDRRKRQWLPALIEPTVVLPLDKLAFLPTFSTLHEYLEIPELYAAVLSPATIKLIAKNDHLLYSQDLPLRKTMVTRIWDIIKQVNTLIEPITAIDNTEGVHYYFGVSGENDIRARCVNFLTPNNVRTIPKLINVNTKMNLSPRDAKIICDMKSYVLMASPYKQCVLHVEDHCIREYQDRDGPICLNHGTSAISYKSSPPSKEELEDLPMVTATGQVIFRLYLTVLHTKKPINDNAVIVGTSTKAKTYLPIQNLDMLGHTGKILPQNHTHTQTD